MKYMAECDSHSGKTNQPTQSRCILPRWSKRKLLAQLVNDQTNFSSVIARFAISYQPVHVSILWMVILFQIDGSEFSLFVETIAQTANKRLIWIVNMHRERNVADMWCCREGDVPILNNRSLDAWRGLSSADNQREDSVIEDLLLCFHRDQFFGLFVVSRTVARLHHEIDQNKQIASFDPNQPVPAASEPSLEDSMDYPKELPEIHVMATTVAKFWLSWQVKLKFLRNREYWDVIFSPPFDHYDYR
jgi:hypothetical protein